MNVRKPSHPRYGLVAMLVCATLLGSAPAAAQAPTVAITGRDRGAHAVGERAGIEVVLDVGAWPALPAPGGTIRIGDPARPGADCVITLPAPPPLGCVWDAGLAGSYALVATYSGDGTYAPAVSNPVSHEILGATAPERVSLPDFASADRNASSASRRPVASADGRWVAYVSADPRLTDDALANAENQALLFDRRTGRTIRVSNAPDGAPANRAIEKVAISGDGRQVAFRTQATNLEAGDAEGTVDWFVADRDTGSVQRLPALRRAPNDVLEQTIVLSFDGRFVAFVSLRADLVANDANNNHDVFRLDRNDGSVVLVSRSLAGGAGDAASAAAAITPDGRHVAFASSSSNLVLGDTNARVDVFVRDLVAGATERVSVSNGGFQVFANASLPAISADARFVAFLGGDGYAPGDLDGRFDILLRDRVGGDTIRASIDPAGGPLGEVTDPSISADGSRVVFREPSASRLHLFDRSRPDLVTFGGALPGSVGDNGSAGETQGLQIAADGRSIVFDTGKAVVVDDRNRTSDVFAYAVADGAVQRVSVARLTGAAAGGAIGPAALDDDGSVVAFLSPAGNLVPGDINGSYDAFVRDRMAARTQLATRTAGGGSSAVALTPDTLGISGDGRFVVFSSRARDLAPNDALDESDVFVHDRSDGSVRMISRRPDGTGSRTSFAPAISRDGRWVAFASADNFLTNPPTSGVNVYLHDTQTSTTRVVPAGGQGFPGAIGGDPRLSGDGRYLVFRSTSSTLVPDDTNGASDVFVFDRVLETLRRVSVAADGTQADGESQYPEISADGRYVAFVSSAGNLVPGDANGRYDVFVVSLASGAIERIGNGNGEPSPGVPPGLSADGRYAVLQASPQGIAAGPAASVDVYVFDRISRQLRTVVPRTPANLAIAAFAPSISADGRAIAFSALSALAPGGARLTQEVFIAANPIAADAGFADGFEGD